MSLNAVRGALVLTAICCAVAGSSAHSWAAVLIGVAACVALIVVAPRRCGETGWRRPAVLIVSGLTGGALTLLAAALLPFSGGAIDIGWSILPGLAIGALIAIAYPKEMRVAAEVVWRMMPF